MGVGFTIFETALGWCALAWSERGVVQGWLPAETQAQVRAAVARKRPEAVEAEPPAFAADAARDVAALMAGETPDLGAVPLDPQDIPELHQRVYEIARAIPIGDTLTYGEVATRLGDRNLAREVGRALGLNPYPPIVPCHRILAASGRTGGFSAPGGVTTKMRLLNVERAQGNEAPSLFGDLPLAAPPRR